MLDSERVKLRDALAVIAREAGELAVTTAGIAKMTMKAITSIAHTKMGIRLSDMPGARSLNTVTTISTATASADTSVNVIICAQTSTRLPGLNCGPESGV